MKRYLVIVVMLALLIPGVLWAQGEGVTLESLTEQVVNITSRVQALERLYMPSNFIEDDGSCVLAFDDSLHPSTVVAYMAISGNIIPDSASIHTVYILPDSVIAITFNVDLWNDEYVTEFWNSCEFQSHSKFWHEDVRGNRTLLE